MTGLILAILFGLNFLLFPCEGQISLPSGGDTFVVLPGENVTITWKLDVSISGVTVRSWTFLPKGNNFAEIYKDGNVDEKLQYSPGPFRIKKNSTLILKSVTIQYNGTYKFYIYANGEPDESYVTVFVAVKPNVTFSCSNPYTINEGDNFTCVCRGEDGNPPANVTWYDKNGDPIGGTGKDEQTLPLMKPKNTNITFNPERAVVGGSVTITCETDGLPEPNYNITHNGTEVSTSKTYTIGTVQYRQAGTYKCVVKNKLGNDSASANLTVIDMKPFKVWSADRTLKKMIAAQSYEDLLRKEPKPPTTRPPSTKPSSASKKPTTTEKVKRGLTVGAIVGIVIGALVLVAIIVIVVVYCIKSKEIVILEDGYRGNANASPGGSGGVAVNHYELDEEPTGGVNNAYELDEEPTGGVDNANDTVNTSGASGSESKPAENTLPPVYAAVDKSNREGKPLYATLDTIALHSDNSKKRRGEERPGQTEYANIDFSKTTTVDGE